MMLMEYLKIRKTRTPKLKPRDLMKYGLCGLFLAVSSLLRKLSIFTPNIIRFKVLNYNINIKLITNIHLNKFFFSFWADKGENRLSKYFFPPWEPTIKPEREHVFKLENHLVINK